MDALDALDNFEGAEVLEVPFLWVNEAVAGATGTPSLQRAAGAGASLGVGRGVSC